MFISKSQSVFLERLIYVREIRPTWWSVYLSITTFHLLQASSDNFYFVFFLVMKIVGDLYIFLQKIGWQKTVVIVLMAIIWTFSSLHY